MKVLVLVARGLRAGALGCYGNPWVDTPALDSLAAGAVVFDRHFADRADPAGARAAWRTGTYDFPLPEGGPAPAGKDAPDLLDSLRTRGVHTRLIVDVTRPSPEGFDSGWDSVQWTQAEGADALEALTDAVKHALGELAGRDDWLLWADLGTALPPWEVPDEFLDAYFTEGPLEGEEEEEEGPEDDSEEEPDEPLEPLTDPPEGPMDPDDDILFLRLHTTHAAAVTYLDAGVGEVLEALGGPGGGGDVAVLLTADCGLPLGEHGVVGFSRPWLHNERVHVPLLLRLPGSAQAGRRVWALTQGVDLAPTLAELFGLSLAGVHGHSLLPLARGEAEPVRPYACSGARAGEEVEWALRTHDWAYLLPVRGGQRRPQLYVKPDDGWEVNDVLPRHQDEAEALERTLRAFAAAAGRPGPLEVPPLEDIHAGPAAPEGGGRA